MTAPQIVFCTERYAAMAEALCAPPRAGGHPTRGVGFRLGEVERKTFPDGERYRRILSDVVARDVILLGGTVDDADTLELYDLACGLVHEGCHILTLVIPWFGYQTMERAIKPGEVITAKTRARLLSSIPIAGSGNRVMLLDLHSEGITQYFSGNIRPVHVYAKDVTLRLIRELAAQLAPEGQTRDAVSRDRLVLGATDAGRAKWVESLANDLGVDAAFVFKRRLSGARTEVTALAADVRGKSVVIYDDMIRTGGSLLGAAEAFRDAGATRIAAVTSHAVLPGDSLEKLHRAGLLDAIACTDSHPNARALAERFPDFLRVASVVDVLAEALCPRGTTLVP